MMPKPQTKRAFHIYHHGNPQSRPLRARSYPPKKWGNLILSSILLKVSARGTPTTMITTIPRAATPMRRQLLRISSESVKKMALAQRKKAFWRRAEKNGKSLLRLGALKGFSGASDIFSFQSLAPVSFGSFLH